MNRGLFQNQYNRRSQGIVIILILIFFNVLIIQHPVSAAVMVVPEDQGILDRLEKCQTVDYDETSFFGSHQNDIYYKIAEIVAKKDVKECDELGDQKEYCLRQQLYRVVITGTGYEGFEDAVFAKNTVKSFIQGYLNKNIALCNNLESEGAKKGCKALISQDPSFCDYSNKEVVSACLSFYYARRAWIEKNVSYCLKIDEHVGDRFQRLYCMVLVSKNPRDVINKYYRKHACYEQYAMRVAKIKNDISICKKILFKESFNKTVYIQCINQFQSQKK